MSIMITITKKKKLNHKLKKKLVGKKDIEIWTIINIIITIYKARIEEEEKKSLKSKLNVAAEKEQIYRKKIYIQKKDMN